MNAFRRQRTAAEQFDSFRGQYESRVVEIADMRKGLRQLERRAALGGGGATGDALGAMRKDIAKREYAVSELESLYKARAKMLKSANRIAQVFNALPPPPPPPPP